MVIRENEIFKRLKGVIETAVSKFGIKGVSVLQSSQPLPTNSHGCVILSRIGVRRMGWQGFGLKNDTGKEFSMSEIYNYVEELTYQVSSYVPRKASDTASAVTAYDIVSAIATWLEMREGDKAMRDVGFQPMRIGEIRVPVSRDDSNTPQFNPNFDWKFFIHQSVETEMPILRGVKGGGPGDRGIFDEGPGGPDPVKEKKYYRDGKGGIWHI